RIALLSDSHLAETAPAFAANWYAARDYVARAAADLTIHLGDVTVDGFRRRADLDYAARLSQGWPTPLRFLPGNHDIGDNPPGPGVEIKEPLDLERLAQDRDAFGPDRWYIDAEGWRLIGLNAQLFGTDTAAEAEQW